MKRMLAIAAALALLGLCACGQAGPEPEETSAETMTKEVITATEKSTTTVIVTEVSNMLDQNAFTFRKAFPDYAFAEVVAWELGKEIDDETSKEELASIETLEFTYSVSDLTGIGQLTGLVEFACYKNEVTEIPAEIKYCKNLRWMNFGKAYSLTTLPKEIAELENLEILEIWMTNVTQIPKELEPLKQSGVIIFEANERAPAYASYSSRHGE